MKKTTAETKERQTINVTDFSIERVNQVKNTIYVNLKINGIYINGCRVVEGKNGDFIAWPSQKGKDGNYYNTVYAALSDEDTKEILNEIQKELDEY